MDLAAWLKDLGLGQGPSAFVANAIDAKVLPSLTSEDLEDWASHIVGHLPNS